MEDHESPHSTEETQTSRNSLTSSSDPDFMPTPTPESSGLRYVWLAVLCMLVLSVVAVGAYIIDSENKQVPALVDSLLTPTPDMPNPTATAIPSFSLTPTATVSAVPTEVPSTPSGFLR
jgi:hypothetical protein